MEQKDQIRFHYFNLTESKMYYLNQPETCDKYFKSRLPLPREKSWSTCHAEETYVIMNQHEKNNKKTTKFS